MVRSFLWLALVTTVPACVAPNGDGGDDVGRDDVDGLSLPDAAVSPAACDFGNVSPGALGRCDVSVTNIGSGTLTINAVTFKPVSDDASTLFEAPSGSARLTDASCNEGGTPCVFTFIGAPFADETIE